MNDIEGGTLTKGGERENQFENRSGQQCYSPMQSMDVLTMLSPKTPLANTKQMRSLQEVKVRMETAPQQGKESIKEEESLSGSTQPYF